MLGQDDGTCPGSVVCGQNVLTNITGAGVTSGPRLAANNDGSVQRRFHRGIIIPEPEEYALVSVLLSLGFVLARRHRMMQNQQRQPAATAP